MTDQPKPVSQFLVNGVPHVICQGCGATVDAHTQGTVPDDGVTIMIEGYYGGFTDTMRPEMPPYVLVICHDCTLKVFRAIPALHAERGLHSTVGDVVCCEYHWTVIEKDDSTHWTRYGDGTERPLRKSSHGGWRFDPDAPRTPVQGDV